MIKTIKLAINIVGSARTEQKPANELVAEFMLLANMRVAEKIATAFPDRAMLRRHPAPDERKLSELSTAAADKMVRLALGYAVYHSFTNQGMFR